MKSIGCILLLSGLSFQIFADNNHPCTKDEEIAAEQVADNLQTWKQLFQAFKLYSQCDDGAVAEGFDDTVDKLLAKNNANYDEFNNLTKHNPTFKTFVFRHLVATGAGDDIVTAGFNAKECYSKTSKPICKDIALALANGIDANIREISKMEAEGTSNQEMVEWKKRLEKVVKIIRKSIRQ